MTPDTWQRVRAEYEAGLAEPSNARAARLGVLRAAGEGDLADEVGALWAAEAAAGSFLGDGSAADPDPLAGTTVGPYRLLHRLGAGGMGAVYLATRADGEYRRRVALKLLKPGMDSEEVLRRFRVERQILAALDHPHIGRLLDGGTTEEGRPYFIMEAVFGEPIDAFCRARPLAERLRLFATVCRAVQFAHQNLVVHRDLKPSNVLVTAEGVPKLLDFGIAKLLNPELGGPTLVATSPIAGPHTPDYASPEQLRGERVTTATDVFSLGVLLSELVTGERPRRGADGELTDARPPGDLGAIVAKALRLTPTDRYPSAAALAEDVERFLDGHPVRARKGTAAYRTRLFIRRHRVGVAIAATGLVAVVGFGVAMAVLAARLAAEQEVAETERRRAERVKEFLTGIFEVADPWQSSGERITAREILDRGAERLTFALHEDPKVRADLMVTIGEIYQHLGLPGRAEPILESALALRRDALGGADPMIADTQLVLALVKEDRTQFEVALDLVTQALEARILHFGPRNPSVAQALRQRGLLERRLGKFAEAEESLRSALLIARDSNPGGQVEAEVLYGLGVVLWDKGRYREAAEVTRAALALQERIFGAKHVDVASSLNLLGALLVALGERDEAERVHRRTLALRLELFEGDHPRIAESLNNLGVLLLDRARYEEADEPLRMALAMRTRLFGDRHTSVATTLANLGRLALVRGDNSTAERAHRQSLEIRETLLGGSHHLVSDSLMGLAAALRKEGRLGEAEGALRRALKIRENTLGGHHPEVARSLQQLAELRLARASPEEAAVLARRAKDIFGLSQAPSPGRLREVENLLTRIEAATRPPA